MRTLILTGVAALGLVAVGLTTTGPAGTTHAAATLAASGYAGRAQSQMVANAEGAGVDVRANARMVALMLFPPSDSGTG